MSDKKTYENLDLPIYSREWGEKVVKVFTTQYYRGWRLFMKIYGIRQDFAIDLITKNQERWEKLKLCVKYLDCYQRIYEKQEIQKFRSFAKERDYLIKRLLNTCLLNKLPKVYELKFKM